MADIKTLSFCRINPAILALTLGIAFTSSFAQNSSEKKESLPRTSSESSNSSYQLAEPLVTRTYRLKLAGNLDSAGLLGAIEKGGIKFESGATNGLGERRIFFFNDRNGVLLVRSAPDEMSRIESFLNANNNTPGANAISLQILQPFPPAQPKSDSEKPRDSASKVASADLSKLYTRTFRVEPALLRDTIDHSLKPADSKNSVENLRNFFASMGVETSNTPAEGAMTKAMFFQEDKGILLVRANLRELDLIESILHAITEPAAQP